MKTYRYALVCVGLACSVSVHAALLQATQLTYQAEGWSSGEITSLNNQGQVVGILQPPFFVPGGGFVDAVAMPFVTEANGRNLKPIFPDYEPYVAHCAGGCHPITTPVAINDAGQIAVSSFTPWSMELKTSLAGPNGGNIPTPPGALTAFGVNLSLNNSGQVAGTYFGPTISFVTGPNGNNLQIVDMLDPNYDSWVTSINDSGQLLVSGVLSGSTESRTFVTQANATGVAFEVGTFGYQSEVVGFNNSAQIFGEYQAVAGGEQRVFITGAGGVGFTDIGSLGGPTFASALNDNGLLVGVSGGKPFLYGYQGGGIVDLNQLVSLRPGEFLFNAPDINDRGQIIAMSNLGYMYLLTPVPEPATYLMFIGGLGLLYWRTRSMSFT